VSPSAVMDNINGGGLINMFCIALHMVGEDFRFFFSHLELREEW
jgi:hypothetical protein